jgi:hypothetical protein
MNKGAGEVLDVVELVGAQQRLTRPAARVEPPGRKTRSGSVFQDGLEGVIGQAWGECWGRCIPHPAWLSRLIMQENTLDTSFPRRGHA